MALSNDLVLACDETNRASLARIFFLPTCDITSMTAGSLQDFTAITTATGKVWFEYEGEFKSKSLNMEGTNENGTATFSNTVEFKIKGLDKTKGKRLQELLSEPRLTAVVEGTNSTGSNKIGFVVGWDDILEKDASGVANVSGVIEGELGGANEYTITFTAEHAEIVRELVGTIETNSSSTVTFGS